MKFTKPLCYLLLGVIAIVICYFYVDRQVVWFFAEQQTRNIVVLKMFANDIPSLLTVLVICFYIYYVIKLMINKPSNTDYKWLLSCNAAVTSLFIKDILKMIFSRYWPGTFICNNPSLINNDVYGFNWYKFGSIFSSFPSGHMAFICALCVSAWCLFPKWRWLWLLLPLLLTIGQIGMYYHFVSDMIAGAMVGSFIGYLTILHYRLRATI